MKHLPKPLAAAAGAAIVVAFAFGGLVAAHALPTTPSSSHASSTAQTAAANADANAATVLSSKLTDTTETTDTTDTTGTQTPDAAPTTHPDNHGATVSAVAQDPTLTGGPHDNHGWYVSCVARGGTVSGTGMTATCSATLHGKSGSHGNASGHTPPSAP